MGTFVTASTKQGIIKLKFWTKWQKQSKYIYQN